MIYPELTQESLKKWVHYNPLNGAFTWLAGTRMIGKYAGRWSPSGYLIITINKKNYFAHRLAWLYVHGSWPEIEIDHIDGVRDNNRLENLRQATKKQNRQNAGIIKDNTSGYKGVWYNKKADKWIAQISVDSKQRLIGRFDTPEEAYKAYSARAKIEYGEFARNI